MKYQAKDDVLSEKDFKRVASFVMGTAGIQLPKEKKFLVEGRLKRRLRELNISSFSEYVDFTLASKQGLSERLHLIDAITTNKTDFFREPEHFKFLENQLIPALANIRDAGWTRPLHCWSAACSSGEEPYTLSIVLNELQRLHYPGLKFQILATDISVSVLKIANQAIYPHDRIEPLSLALRKQYLFRSKNRGRDDVRMSPQVRQPVTFKHMNLLTDAFTFSHPVDVIFCRNVMIYFSTEDRMRLIRKFFTLLQPGGYLFIGHSETIKGFEGNLVQIAPTIYQKQ